MLVVDIVTLFEMLSANALCEMPADVAAENNATIISIEDSVFIFGIKDPIRYLIVFKDRSEIGSNFQI